LTGDFVTQPLIAELQRSVREKEQKFGVPQKTT